MPSQTSERLLLQLSDKVEIQDALCRYARGVDRSDWDLVRSTYHPDARDEHGEYSGDIDGLIEWLKHRFENADNGMHFLGNCLVEFAGPNLAFVETYFISQRMRTPLKGESAEAKRGDAMCRQGWGRYLDRFERRNGEWRVAHRKVVMDAAFVALALGGARTPALTWGRRDRSDPMYESRSRILGEPSQCIGHSTD